MQYALITGASSGIGTEIARVLATKGYNLLLVARSGDKLTALANELAAAHNITAKTLSSDLSKPDAPAQVFQYTQQEGIEVEVLVNNAGFADFGEFWLANWDKNAEMIDLNIKTLTHLTHLFLPGMVARKSGRVLNVASTAAFMPGPLMSVYYATKAYVLSFSEAIANELMGTGVTVTALCPGPTASNFQSKAEMGDSKLVKGAKLPSALVVAEYGVKAMLQGKTVAIHGFMNRILANIPRLLPRKIVASMVRNAQDRTH